MIVSMSAFVVIILFDCRSNCHTKVMQDFRKHYEKPDFLPLDSETSQQDWFFMGGSGPGAPVHVSFKF